MHPSKKSAPNSGKDWNFGGIGTRWSSRTSSLLSTAAIHRQTTIPIPSNSRGNPATQSKADSDDEEHSGSELPQPRSVTSFLEGGQESSTSQGLLTTSTSMANRRSQKSTTPSSRVPTPKTSSSLSPVPSLVQTPLHTSCGKSSTNMESCGLRPKGSGANSGSVEKKLQEYILEMKKNHAYMVRSTLTAARLDLNSRKPLPSIIYDQTSPFENMKSIEITATEAKDKKLDVGRFSAKMHGKAHSSSEIKMVVPVTISETPKTLAQMPKYHSYTTLKNNILADDDEIMRYHPYFGEDVEDELNLDDTYVDKTKSNQEEGEISESKNWDRMPPSWKLIHLLTTLDAAMHTTFVNSFLKDLDLSLSSVTHYLLTPNPRNESTRRMALPKDFDPHDPKVSACREKLKADISADELDRAETACMAFKRIAKFSMWEIVKRADQMVKERVDPPRTGMGGGREDSGGVCWREGRGAAEGEDPAPYSLESYAALNCLLCFMHECPFHVNKDHDRLAMSTITTTTGKEKPRLTLATSVRGWSYGAIGAMKDPWNEKEGQEIWCSEGCFMKENNKETAETGAWSTAQLELLRSSAGVLKMNARCACLIACIINKPCAEIYRQLGIENLLMPVSCQTENHIARIEHNEPRPGAKRKKPAIPSLPGYPADCYLTHAHERRSAFQACRHLGQCTESCPCVLSHVTCEKSCICSPDCHRRWRGCACKREGRSCTKDSCMCVRANRECDVDLCHSCGATEALDPANRYNEELVHEGCQNVWLQRDLPKRTLLGRSAVAGFGLFVGEDVKKDAFLGEYKGEVITSEEADRRGKLYDKRGVSFLFNLNLNHVIDATRAGNKFRYINHSKTSPNCGAKVFMVNCTHRIGMFARRDLLAGEELFFDYGYNNKQIKFVQKEFELPEMIKPSAATGAAKKRRPRKKELEYLKGGKGTTERSRARITAAEANIVANKPAMTTTLPISTAATRVRDRSARSSEYNHETSEDDHQEDEMSGGSVDEEYEPEPETEESLAVVESGSAVDVTDVEESEEEPPRRLKRVRARAL